MHIVLYRLSNPVMGFCYGPLVLLVLSGLRDRYRKEQR